MKLIEHTYPDGKKAYTTDDNIQIEVNKQPPVTRRVLESDTVKRTRVEKAVKAFTQKPTVLKQRK